MPYTCFGRLTDHHQGIHSVNVDTSIYLIGNDMLNKVNLSSDRDVAPYKRKELKRTFRPTETGQLDILLVYNIVYAS